MTDFASTDMLRLETGRLALEPQIAAHADAMFDVLSDPAIYQYENAPPRSREWLRKRYARLESRASADGLEHWLNWVIRLRTLELIGYVQATVRTNGRAAIAYELASGYWGHGYASEAVAAMLDELGRRYGVQFVSAILKRANERSRRLLERVGFVPAPASYHDKLEIDPDELLMCRTLP